MEKWRERKEEGRGLGGKERMVRENGKRGGRELG